MPGDGVLPLHARQKCHIVRTLRLAVAHSLRHASILSLQRNHTTPAAKHCSLQLNDLLLCLCVGASVYLSCDAPWLIMYTRVAGLL